MASLGILLYRAAGPLLTEFDPWQIGVAAGAASALIVSAVIVSARLRRRQLASRIKRR